MEYANHLNEYAPAWSEAQVAEEVARIRAAAKGYETDEVYRLCYSAIDLTTLSHYCRKYNDKVFVGRATKQFLNGRTPRECGFSFVPKEEHGL